MLVMTIFLNLNPSCSQKASSNFIKACHHENRLKIDVLANRNNGIQNYYDENDIVLNVDVDDAFIGRRLLNLLMLFVKNSEI